MESDDGSGTRFTVSLVQHPVRSQPRARPAGSEPDIPANVPPLSDIQMIEPSCDGINPKICALRERQTSRDDVKLKLTEHGPKKPALQLCNVMPPSGSDADTG